MANEIDRVLGDARQGLRAQYLRALAAVAQHVEEGEPDTGLQSLALTLETAVVGIREYQDLSRRALAALVAHVPVLPFRRGEEGEG